MTQGKVREQGQQLLKVTRSIYLFCSPLTLTMSQMQKGKNKNKNK